jgi:hypothetical protein
MALGEVSRASRLPRSGRLVGRARQADFKLVFGQLRLEALPTQSNDRLREFTFLEKGVLEICNNEMCLCYSSLWRPCVSLAGGRAMVSASLMTR